MPEPRTILIADDDAMTRGLIRRALTPLGHRIEEAANGQEALEKAGELRPDLVLLDVLMPKGHGFSVCKELRARPELAHARILFLTSKAYTADRHQAMEMGADGFLNKPFVAAELQNAVRSLLGE